MVKLSVVIAVLESYEVVRRQLLHFNRMNLEYEAEFIIVDDGSAPPIASFIIEHNAYDFSRLNYVIIETGDLRPWSQPCARNLGADIAVSNKLLMTDIDHILTEEAIRYCIDSDDDKVMFPRKYGVLNTVGQVTQDRGTLASYGLDSDEVSLYNGHHYNTFMMKKEIFDELGGYNESYCGKYGGDDTDFSRRYRSLFDKGKVKPHVMGPDIFVYPDPAKDKRRIFHSLRR